MHFYGGFVLFNGYHFILLWNDVLVVDQYTGLELPGLLGNRLEESEDLLTRMSHN